MHLPLQLNWPARGGGGRCTNCARFQDSARARRYVRVRVRAAGGSVSPPPTRLVRAAATNRIKRRLCPQPNAINQQQATAIRRRQVGARDFVLIINCIGAAAKVAGRVRRRIRAAGNSPPTSNLNSARKQLTQANGCSAAFACIRRPFRPTRAQMAASIGAARRVAGAHSPRQSRRTLSRSSA